MIETLIGKAAISLCRALHKAGPVVLGQEIAGIVEKHSIGAAASALGVAWLPGVGSTAALALNAGFVWSMYYRINTKAGIPFSKHILKSLGTGIATNLVSSAVGTMVGAGIATAFTFIPLVGGIAASAIMASVVFTLTWSCGLVYLKVLTRFAEANVDFENVSEDELKEMADDVMAKEDIKEMMKQAKQQFKAAKERGDIDQAKAESHKKTVGMKKAGRQPSKKRKSDAESKSAKVRTTKRKGNGLKRRSVKSET